MLIATIIAGLVLAFANGANDNIKGVATLVGSKTMSLRLALIYAAITTFLGSVSLIILILTPKIQHISPTVLPNRLWWNLGAKVL